MNLLHLPGRKALLGDIVFIAEVKPRKPGEASGHDKQYLLDIAMSYGDMISIHTNSIWGGSFDDIRWARKQTKKPILAKGIHAHDLEIQLALDAGADFVLVVNRIPSSQIPVKKCIIEANTIHHLKRVPSELIAAWNSRDIEALLAMRQALTRPSFDEARKAWPAGTLVQASNLETISDVHPLANAVLVGTHLPTFIHSALKTR